MPRAEEKAGSRSGGCRRQRDSPAEAWPRLASLVTINRTAIQVGAALIGVGTLEGEAAVAGEGQTSRTGNHPGEGGVGAGGGVGPRGVESAAQRGQGEVHWQSCRAQGSARCRRLRSGPASWNRSSRIQPVSTEVGVVAGIRVLALASVKAPRPRVPTTRVSSRLL